MPVSNAPCLLSVTLIASFNIMLTLMLHLLLCLCCTGMSSLINNSGGRHLDAEDLEGMDEEKPWVAKKRMEREQRRAQLMEQAVADSGLSADDVEQCRALFDEIDFDEDDSITGVELRQHMVKSMGEA